MNELQQEEIKQIKEAVIPTEEKREHKILVLDTETGGLNPYTDGLCSITIKELNKDEEETFFIKPQWKFYGQSAFDINHLNLDYLKKHGLGLDTVMNHVLEKMGEECTIIGHNIEFDLKFLLAAAKYTGKKFKTVHYICTMNLAKKHLIKKTLKNNGQVENHKLTTIYQYFFNDFNEEKAHTSSYDVFMTEAIYNKLIKLEK